MHLYKRWDELIKTVAYLKNWSLSINGITPYELDNHVRPDFSHLKMHGFKLVYIFSKKKGLSEMYAFGKEFLLVMKVEISIVFAI